MILGSGVDIIEIERIERAASKQGFVNKLLTQNEKEYWESKGCAVQTLAGLFAAKEAVSKALGTGFGKTGLKDIEIQHSKNGTPYAALHGEAAIQAKSMGAEKIFVSISHCKLYAIAQAVAEGNE